MSRPGGRFNAPAAGLPVPAAVGGNRLDWCDLPVELQRIIEDRLGSTVVAAYSQPGGFSQGLAARLRLSDGRMVFAKAVSAARNPDSPGAHRREAQILSALPAAVPAPRLLWSGQYDDWVALLIEDVDGRSPAQPWIAAELDQALMALGLIADVLTPNPTHVVDHVVREYAEEFTGWRTLAAQPALGPAGTPSAAQWDWAWRNLDRLARLEESWQDATVHGATLMHFDVRADNMILTERGLVLVDWPHAVVGPAWMDLLVMMPSAIMQGVAEPEMVWHRHPPARRADPDAVNATLAAVAGYFVRSSLRPAPLNLPNVRAFQAAQGVAALDWLRERLG